MTGKLTAKQEMFCREYLVDLNATQAAIRAGYSEKTAKEIGCENLTKPNIQEYIQAQMNKRAERVEITADYVLNGIKDLTERCIQAEPVVVDGQHTGEWKFEVNGAFKGYELMGKHLKLFTDKVDHSGAIDNNHTMSDTDRELLERYINTKKEPNDD